MKKAIELYQTAANLNNVNALVKLGYYYFKLGHSHYDKKTDEYYIRVYSFVGELSQISDSCGSVFYSLQPFPSDNTKVKTYHAYIKDFNDSYQLKINDKLMFDIGNKAMS